MKHRGMIRTIFAAALAGGCLFFAACENDEKVLKSLQEKKITVEEVKGVESYLSQQGKMKAKLTAPLMNRYMADSPYVEFPKTLHVDFFEPNDSLKIESKLDALYGKYLESSNKVLLRDSIVVVNLIKKDTLWCQELYWDQNTEMFYTDKPVRIRTQDRILLGTGMEATQKFDRWTIKQPRGTVGVPAGGF
jgi:LPS export ABC transporter protein LptC